MKDSRWQGDAHCVSNKVYASHSAMRRDTVEPKIYAAKVLSRAVTGE